MPDAAPRHPHLRHLLSETEQTQAAFEAFRRDLSEAQLAWRPAPGAWSIAECAEHLVITDGRYLPRIQSALDRAAPSSADYRPGWFARWFLGIIDPEQPRKVKTAPSFRPAAPDPAALDRYLALGEELRGLLQKADGLDLNGPKLSSPATRLVRFTPGEALTLLVRHGRRHLDQARRVRQHPDFPQA